MVVHAGSINRDHVHMLVDSPSLSVSRAVQHLKGRSSHRLLSEFGLLRKRYWGQHLWARGYWVVSSGNVTDDMWIDYIKNQAPPEPDDSFNVTRVAAPSAEQRTGPALSRNRSHRVRAVEHSQQIRDFCTELNVSAPHNPVESDG